MAVNNFTWNKYNLSNHSQDNLIEDFLKEKEKSILQIIKELSELVEQRKDISEDILSILNAERQKIQNLISTEDMLNQYSGITSQNKKAFKKHLLEIEKQRRKEKVQLWQDVLGLKKDLVELINNLEKSKAKANILG